MTRRALRVQGPRLRFPMGPGRAVAAARRRVRAAADPVMPGMASVLPTIEAGVVQGRVVRTEPGAAVARPVVRRVPDPVRAVLPRPATLPFPRALPGLGWVVQPVSPQLGGRAAGEVAGGVGGLQARPGVAIHATQRASGAAAASAPARIVRLVETVAPRLLVPELPVPPGPVAAAARPVAVPFPVPGPVLAGPASFGVAASGRASPSSIISSVRADARPVAPRAARPLPPGVEAAEREDSAPEGQALSPQSGTVLLDGQLVGQWLMERMARDAERPPAGLTGFDVRQAPGWSLG